MPLRPERLGRYALAFALTLNLLDLTTSLIPSPADHALGVPARSTEALVVQLLLLVPLFLWLARHARACLRALASLPVPRAALLVLGSFVLIECVHVMLRAERYPFSPVAMFSSAMPIPDTPYFTTITYIVRHENGSEFVSFMREGNPFFARHDFDYDYKAGWAMRMYAPTHSSARDVVREQIMAEGFAQPTRVSIRYERASGRVFMARPLE